MEVVGLVIAGLIVGVLGRLANPGSERRAWAASIGIGVGVVVGLGVLLGGIGFWGYALAAAVAAGLVVLAGRALGRRAES